MIIHWEMSEGNVSSLPDVDDCRFAVKVILGLGAAVVGFLFLFIYGHARNASA